MRLKYAETVYAQVYKFSVSLITNANSKLAAFNGTNWAGGIVLFPGPNGTLFQFSL